MSKKNTEKKTPALVTYELKLFITGTRPQSIRAITNIQKICQSRLNGRYSLQIVDVYQQPEQAVTQQIIAAPTLVKMQPLPMRRMIGDMSNEERLLAGLDLHAQ